MNQCGACEAGIAAELQSRWAAGRLTLLTAAAFSCALLAVVVEPIHATGQQPERIRLDGSEYLLLTNPLGMFLDSHPDALPAWRGEREGGVSEVIDTSLWRGYRGSWSIRNGALYLETVEILVGVEESERSSAAFRDVTEEMFDRASSVRADWFSGYLVIPTGELAHYVHMDYASLYKRYRVLRVERGSVVSENRFRRRGFTRFRDAQFEKFKETDLYRTLMAQPNATDEYAMEVAQGGYTSTIFD
jgi:hypothetical protein